MKTELEERSKIEAVKNRENLKILDEIQEKPKNAVEQENDVKFKREKNAKNKDFFERNKKESEKEMNLARKCSLFFKLQYFIFFENIN